MSTDTTTTTPEPGRNKKRRRWLLPTAVGAVALTVGYAMGAGGEEGASAASDETEELQSQVADLTAEREAALDDREDKLDDRDAALAEKEANTDDGDGEQEDSADDSNSENSSDNGDADGGGYSAGQYRFSDVQVYDDGLESFALRARVTNTGGDKEGVIWTATLFSGGSVVGTLTGSAENFTADSTITAEFWGTDSFGDWDEVEFQVDTEF